MRILQIAPTVQSMQATALDEVISKFWQMTIKCDKNMDGNVGISYIILPRGETSLKEWLDHTIHMEISGCNNLHIF